MNPRLPEPQSGALATELYPPCKNACRTERNFRGALYASFKTFCRSKSFETGTPAGIRTLDLRLRRPLLYPAELQAHTRPAWPCRNRAKSHTADINVFYQKDIMLSRAKKQRIGYNMKGFALTFGGADCIIDLISAVSGRAAQPCPPKREPRALAESRGGRVQRRRHP